jgi:hypothetical protein
MENVHGAEGIPVFLRRGVYDQKVPNRDGPGAICYFGGGTLVLGFEGGEHLEATE